MEEEIAIIIVILISNWRISKWRKEAATAHFIIGQKSTSSEEREWAYRKAFKYGHTKAKLFYIYAAANTFSGRKPLTPFTIISDKGESPIVAIFYVNGNQKCSDFGNSECSIFGIKTIVLLASAVQ